MSTRVTGDVDPSVAQQSTPLAQATPNLVAAITADADDRYGSNALPSDHPHWMKDTLSISQRARALLQKIKPAIVRVITVWDHRVRSVAIGNRTLKVDASGSYRFD